MKGDQADVVQSLGHLDIPKLERDCFDILHDFVAEGDVSSGGVFALACQPGYIKPDVWASIHGGPSQGANEAFQVGHLAGGNFLIAVKVLVGHRRQLLDVGLLVDGNDMRLMLSNSHATIQELLVLALAKG